MIVHASLLHDFLILVPRQSEFARRRQLQKASKETTAPVEKPAVPENTIIGEIVEKRYDEKVLPMEMEEAGSSTVEAFPKPNHLKVLP